MQACHISGFFIALPALRLSRENLRQNHKISGICFLAHLSREAHKLSL